MKAPESTETADSTEQNGSARREESSDLGISTTHTQGPDIRLSGIGQHGEPLCTPFEDPSVYANSPNARCYHLGKDNLGHLF